MTFKKINVLASIFLFAALPFAQQANAEKEAKIIFRAQESYMTSWNDDDNIDSPAFWINGKESLLIATSKDKHDLWVYNALNGKLIKRIGKEGAGKLEFLRPNGIWVIDNLMLICERDNHRVQVISLPDFSFVGYIGTDELIKPYGLTVYKTGTSYKMYVTDQYEDEENIYVAFDKLNRRVKEYEFSLDGGFNSKFIKAFGETKGKGMLTIVESIYADPANNNLLIAEEDKNQNVVKIYDLDGNYKNMMIGDDIFKYQAEGIALYDKGNGEGYWFCTDQDFFMTKNNTIHVFNRKTLAYLGSFITGKTENTDGIWITQASFGKFKGGALFAVHNDGGVSAFDLSAILTKMGLTGK